MKLVFYAIILTAFFVWIGNFAIVVAHEHGHAQLCKYAGGTPKIRYSELGFHGITTCSNLDKYIFAKEYSDGMLEILHYPLLVIYNFLALFFGINLMGIGYIIEKFLRC